MSLVIYTRGTVPVHRIFLMKALFEEGDRLNAAKCPDVVYINRGSKLWWGWDEEQLLRLGDVILSVCATKSGSDKHIGGMETAARRAIEGAEKIRSMDLTKISDKELSALYDDFYKECKDAHGWLNIDIDVIDVVLEKHLRKEIQKELPARLSENELETIYHKLLQPACLTYVNKEELAIIKNVSVKDRTRAARELCEQFYWTSLGWESVAPHTEEYFLQRLEEIFKKSDLDKEVSEIEGRVERIKREREAIIKKYALSSYIQHWIEVLDRYTVLHDTRKEMQVRTVYEFYRIMKEAGHRLKLDPDDLEWLTYSEVQGLIGGKKLDKAEVERRKKSAAIIIRNGKMELYSGDAAEEIFKKEIPQEDFRTKEIRGMSANKGHATGFAKVCNGRDDALRKIQAGDILVCGMTLPDYVPAMKKAAAIVTDEGGITCHAAIVSRELGKPCVIGTRIATQVLKDGDFVEVDANRGIVKIIKHA